MRLIIAEKPSLGREIANTLGVKSRETASILTSSGDRVTWAFGHLLQQAEPDHYLSDSVPTNEKGKKVWRLEDLPILPEEFAMIVKDKDIFAHMKQIKVWINEADSIIHAGDPDREGQIIVDEILEMLNNKKPVQRLWLQDLTQKGISRALANMKDNQAYAPLSHSALGRQRGDWLVGMNLTRAMTLVNSTRSLLSVGRVQSAVAMLVVQRDLAIENFVAKDFFELFAHTQNALSAKYIMTDDMTDDQGYCTNASVLEAVKQQVLNKGYITVDEVNRKTVKSNAPLPYSLSLLQKEANKRYGFSAQQVLDIAQKLYEAKLTSYPRTDCQYLAENQHGQAKQILESLSTSYATAVAGADASLKSSAYNDSKVTAHTAIIPTGKEAQGLSDSEQKLFDMIAIAFIAQFYPAQISEATEIKLSCDHHKFIAKGKVVVEKGWTAIIDDESKDKTLPSVAQGDQLALSDVELVAKKTTPPQRFTEGTLIDAMLNIAKYVTNESDKAQLKESDGIGTEATRGNIIETLKTREYIEVKGKQIISTTKARDLMQVLPSELSSPVMTATWERKLKEVESKTLTLEAFEQDIKEFVKAQVETIKSMSVAIGKSREQAQEDAALGVCPKCGKGHIIENQKAFGCSDWKAGCDFKIWREVAGKKLTKGQVKQLITKRETKDAVEGFTSKAGKVFAARLRLKEDLSGVEFVFEQNKKGA